MKENNQEFLKKLDKFDKAGDKIIFRIFIVLYAIFAIVSLVFTFYFGICVVKGSGKTEQFFNCFAILLTLAAIPACGKLFDLFIKWFFHKDNLHSPAAMKLPIPGTISLEDALHKMSDQIGVLLWDAFWGCILFSLLFVIALEQISEPRSLFLCLCVVVLIVLGHLLFHLLWKKHSFTNKMLCCTSKYLSINHPEYYAQVIERSLKQNILSYEKELILTDEYVLGRAEWDNAYHPTAIPREQIEEFLFFYQRKIGGLPSRTVGILSCRIKGGKTVNLVLGPEPTANKILRILNHCQIAWVKG